MQPKQKRRTKLAAGLQIVGRDSRPSKVDGVSALTCVEFAPARLVMQKKTDFSSAF